MVDQRRHEGREPEAVLHITEVSVGGRVDDSGWMGPGSVVNGDEGRSFFVYFIWFKCQFISASQPPNTAHSQAVSAGRVGQEVIKHCASVPTRNEIERVSPAPATCTETTGAV